MNVFGIRRRSGVCLSMCLLTAIAVTLPAVAAAAEGTESGKAAALLRLERSGGSGSSTATTAALSRQLTPARQPSARVAVAAAADPPATTPSDLLVTGTSGVVTISATSTAPFVLFAADGTALGAPAAVTTATATTSAATWAGRTARAP